MLMKVRSTLLMILLVALGSEALAGVALRYSPADTAITPGDQTRISIVLDQAQDIRTIEVYVTFDRAVVQSLDGGPGDLFTASGFMLFKGFEEIEPGQWHGYVVIMGSGDQIVGPGELYFWNVSGLAPGTSPVTTLEIGLADGDGVILSDVSLDATSITVASTGSGTDLPASLPGIRLYPNPFNPSVNIRFDVQREDWVRLGVFDLRGNLVSRLYEGVVPEGILNQNWKGRDDTGQVQPGGVYLFRLESSYGIASTKGVLLK
jgi:hypothetical protein